MTESRIALEAYTLRDFLKTPADIAKTFKRVREIGYEAVELAGLGSIDARELKTILDGEGLVACSTHTSFLDMKEKTQEVIETHQIWGCKHLAPGSMPKEYQTGADGYKTFAQEATAVAKLLAEGGLTWSYHNHDFEFQKFGDKIGMDILMSESDPKLFNMELDTYWVQAGGGEPTAWILKSKGRIPFLHLKDMTTIDRKPVMAEIGEGNLNWPGILSAAKEAGVEWYVVEQDVCQTDPFECIATSFKNIQAMGLR